MYQKIILVGNLGRDPEMRYMADGTAVTSFSIAVNRRFNDRASGQQRDETVWFRVNVWGKQAETANQYLTKGKQVLVEGQMQFDPQTGGPKLFTRQDGSIGASFEVRAETFRFIGSKGDGSGGSYEGGGASYAPAAAQEEDDIPF
jgi:single-strand DNA-binding protein